VDVSRGDVLTTGPVSRGSGGEGEAPSVGQRFEAELVWMDERPLDPGRLYLLKHNTRTVTAEVSQRLVLNQIGSVRVSTSGPLVFDAYARNRATGNFILVDPATQFTAGAGMITRALDAAAPDAPAPLTMADRLARAAREAGSDEEAVAAVQRTLDEILT
jgi:sulfate adenylyltransferase subunit 1 (EFTu-like GTPase family)